MDNVSFTGHREINADAIKEPLYATLEELINNGSDMFFTGGAAGFDTLAALTVLDLRVTYPWISLSLILPCSPEEQTRSFTRELRDTYYDILRSADKVEYVCEHYTRDCMKQRNQRLIDCADICVCCYDERKSASGTGQTVRMAEKKGIRIINLYDRND